jgi:serine kinase of HPr protein (carbohydrate metabolism regulator)
LTGTHTRPAVHADCVVIGTRGLLIRGASGSGKSSLADVLVEAARAKGNLGLLVADDYVYLDAVEDRLAAHVPDTIKGRMELRGFGLVDPDFMAAARVHAIVELTPREQIERLPDTPLTEDCLQGVRLPVIICPQTEPGHSLRLIRWAFRRLFPDGPDYI